MPKLYGPDDPRSQQATRAEARAKLMFFIQRAIDLLPAMEQIVTQMEIARAAAAAGDHAAVHAAAHAAAKPLHMVVHCVTDVSILASVLKLETTEHETQEKTK